MEEVLSNVLTTDRLPSRSTFAPANTPHPATLVSHADPNEITHAWLLEQRKSLPTFLPSIRSFFFFLFS